MLKTACFFLVLVTVFSGVAGKPRDAKATKTEKEEVFEDHKNWMISPEEVRERSKKRGFDLLGATSSSVLGGSLESYGPYFGWSGHYLAGGLGANSAYFSSAFEQSPWVQYQMSPQIVHSLGFMPAYGSALGHLQVGLGLTPEAMPIMGEVASMGIVNEPQIVQLVQPVQARYVRVHMMVPGYLMMAGVLLNPLPCKDTCQIQFEVGSCAPGERPRPVRHWFHNVQKDTCVPFIYSGCGGNDNNFATPQQCMRACVKRKPCKRGYRHPTPTSKICVPIPVDGGFTRWTPFSRCSRPCGRGIQVRTRTCTNPVPRFGGKNCRGFRVERKFCYLRSCAVNGGYTPWTEYGSCSKTCGVGIKRRTRTCTRPAPAFGGADCSRLGPAFETKPCLYKSCAINGAYTRWTEWNGCSAKCGAGTQTRSRTCTNPAPAFGGMPCRGQATETRSCKIKECPINGAYAAWTEWGGCSAECGDGTQIRSRTCTNPAPAYGGKPCQGKAKETRSCKIKECKIPDPCEINKGGCSHHCTFSGVRGDPAVCSCDEGYELAGDLRTCVESATCRTAANVGFILDASGSLKDHFGLEKQFLNAVAGAFSITKTGSRASVITFSDRSELSIKFSDFDNIIEFTNKVNHEIENMDSNTRIDVALKLAKTDMFAEANGMRPKLPKILFLMTDGSQTVEAGSEPPAPIAAQLRADGIELICVGIGKEVKKDELVKIAGNANNVYTADNFQMLVSESFIDNIKAKACPGNQVGGGSVSSGSISVGGGSVSSGSISVGGGSVSSGSLSVGGGSVSSGSLSLGGGSASSGSFSFGGGGPVGSVQSVTTTTYKMTINGKEYAFAVGSDGQISINGKTLTLVASDSSKYSALAGWKMFTQGGVKFYFTMHGEGGKPQIVPMVQQVVILKATVNGKMFNFKFSQGVISIGGQNIMMSASSSSEYPASAGYKMFVYKGITFYFLKRGGEYKLIPVVKSSGQIKVTVGGVEYHFAMTASGQLSIDGHQIVMTPSTASHHSGADGWMTFTYKGITFYFRRKGNHVKLVHLTKQAAKASLSASVNGREYHFTWASGHLSIDGHQIRMVASKSSKHSAAAGWKMFTYKGTVFYFAKLGGHLQLQPASSTQVHMTVGSRSYNFIVDENGQVSANGAQMHVTSSTNPTYLGWKTWSFDGFNFYLHTIGGKVDIKVEKAMAPDAAILNDEKEEKDPAAKIPLRVSVDGKTYPFYWIGAADGHLSIDDQQVQMVASNDKRYPSESGYMTFTYKGQSFYFTKKGGALKLFGKSTQDAAMQNDEKKEKDSEDKEYDNLFIE